MSNIFTMGDFKNLDAEIDGLKEGLEKIENKIDALRDPCIVAATGKKVHEGIMKIPFSDQTDPERDENDLDISMFDKLPEQVYKALIGKSLVRTLPDGRKIQARIVKLGVYQREEHEVDSRYGYLLDTRPGQVSFKNVYGYLVCIISTRAGSRLKLNAIELDSKVITKTGEIAEALLLHELIPVNASKEEKRAPRGLNLADTKGKFYIE